MGMNAALGDGGEYFAKKLEDCIDEKVGEHPEKRNDKSCLNG